ncbi:MAG: hypothetical protein AAF065_12145 [Verrucomicrobiota bacterium]
MIHSLQPTSVGVLLLALALNPSALAFEQGSLFLFDIREAEENKGVAGRIHISPSTFTTEKKRPKTQTAIQPVHSEFEVDFTALGSDTTISLTSDFEVGTFDTNNSFGEDSLGDEDTQMNGFNFNY